ncbi:MAG TPA: macro domain-containing protein [Isosphaeraceae bacterium]|jgi:O-acetyl-ADP-ribose deacetylase (regulator of RNase III)
MSDLKLILVDPDSPLCASFHTYFKGLPDVEIVNDVFENLPAFDCFVTAANSFGQMDAGVDAAVVRYFGLALMRRIQEHILAEYLGEQPVGTSFLAETGHPDHPFVAHTPTMRVPMAVDRTDYVYVALWATLLEVRRHNRRSDRRIGVLACPGLGTGYGRVPPVEAARQMALAYKHFLHPPERLNWTVAALRQKEIRFGGNSPPDVP